MTTAGDGAQSGSEADRWLHARLIPTYGIRSQDEQEKRATSCLLAVMHGVPEFGHALLRELGAPKSPSIDTFAEVRFKNADGKVDIPDGAIVCRRGAKRWTCLVEVKTGAATLKDEQVGKYLDIARDHCFDGVLTISNQITHIASESPVAVDGRKLRKTALWHFSWWRILTEAVVLSAYPGRVVWCSVELLIGWWLCDSIGRSVMGCMVSKDDGWRMPDWLWERVEPLLPAPPFHPLGTHRSRVPDRDAMDAILLVLRTGMQWNALNATGVCSSSSAHRRFQEWGQAGVFAEIWRQGLLEYDKIVGIDWAWLAADGAMTKAPLGGPKTGPNPTDRAKGGRSVRFSARERGSRSGWRMTVPTATTRSC